jgi:hypothetical protein
LNQGSIDSPDITEELKDYQINGNSKSLIIIFSNAKTASALVSA